MSESVIADFVAKFNASTIESTQPIKGRVLLSQKRLVLAADGGKVTIPLSSIADVAVGYVPPELGEFFDSTVSIAFERGEGGHVCAVEAEDDKIRKFSTLLFQALLNGLTATVKHPARVGGRVVEEPFQQATISVGPDSVAFQDSPASFVLDVASIVNFERRTREIDGRSRDVIAVGHLAEGRVVTSLIALDSARLMGILGRYLLSEYGDEMSELGDLELSDRDTRLLVALYSGGADVSLSNLFDMEEADVESVLTEFDLAGLIEHTDDGVVVTEKGHMLVTERVEDLDL